MTQETNRSSVTHLADRGAVRVTGPDAAKFLQGLVTIDVEGLVTKIDDVAFAASAAHAAMLSPQGKILFEFFCVRTPDGFVLDVLREKAPELVKRLSMYKLRAAVEIKDVSEDYELLALWGPNAISHGPTVHTVAFIDPRNTELGQRILAPTRFAPDIASATSGFDVSPAAYHAHRIALGIPEGGKDYDFGDAYPHEANFDLLNGVSFTKGCYVGQEIVARMQHKTVVRKRVVGIVGQSYLTQGAEIKHRDVALGRIGSVDGANALALIRLDRVVEALASEQPIVANGVPIGIKTEDLRRHLDAVATRDKA